MAIFSGFWSFWGASKGPIRLPRVPNKDSWSYPRKPIICPDCRTRLWNLVSQEFCPPACPLWTVILVTPQICWILFCFYFALWMSVIGDCYMDSALDIPTIINRRNLTVDYCKNWCKASSYGLAAIMKGIKCGCTNEPIDLHKEVGKHLCSSECSGQVNTTGLCGGSKYWTIYVLETTTTNST